jgi:hypothetical protein
MLDVRPGRRMTLRVQSFAAKKQGKPVWFVVATVGGCGFWKKPYQEFQFYATVKFLQEYLLKQRRLRASHLFTSYRISTVGHNIIWSVVPVTCMEARMGVSLKLFPFSIAALFAITFPGLAQSAKPPVSIVISAPQAVRAGSKIKMDVTLTNVSNHGVIGYFEDVSHSEFNYDFDVRDSEGKPAPETRLMRAEKGLDPGPGPHIWITTHLGVGGYRVKPGESIKGSADLSELYNLQPGTYTVQLSWWENRARYRDPQKPRPPAGAVVAKSNTITVTITP